MCNFGIFNIWLIFCKYLYLSHKLVLVAIQIANNLFEWEERKSGTCQFIQYVKAAFLLMNAAQPSLNINSIKTSNGININGCVRSKSCEPVRVVRQYINPAVYIESSIYDMAPFRRSPLFINYASDDESVHRIVKVKRCNCFTNPNNCPCHPRNSARETYDRGPDTKRDAPGHDTDDALKGSPTVSHTSLKSEDDSGITVRDRHSFRDELKLSIPSVTTVTTLRALDDTQKEEAFRMWCARKDQEKKLQEEKEALIREIKEKEKDAQLQQERENFKRWLANKKKDEEMRKKEKLKELEEERLKQEEKEKRLQENDLHYQLWRKKKEELYLEKKIEEQMKLLQSEEEKRKRTENSMKAYDLWLKSSKNKPKPIPLNQGLQTLRSSVSVAYVNPTPWVPNIDTKPKPASQ